MATNKTANYGLNQWVKSDQVVMADFNADNAAIDAALGELNTRTAALLQAASGTYTGTGSTSNTIQIGFKPQFVLICRGDTPVHRLFYLGNNTAFLLDDGTQASTMCTNNYYKVTATDSGLYLRCTYSYETNKLAAIALNTTDKVYNWFALG